MLAELAAKYGTDKLAHGYLPIYERHLPKKVDSLLEIGVFNGASLCMWRDRYPEARIVGIDINPNCAKPEGCEVYVGSQDDPELLNDIGTFDVVVDDGSHVNSLTLASFKHLWPKTHKLYVIEDLGCSYVDLTPHVASWPGMHHNPPLDYNNQRSDVDAFLTERIHDIDGAGGYSLHIYNQLAVFER